MWGVVTSMGSIRMVGRSGISTTRVSWPIDKKREGEQHINTQLKQRDSRSSMDKEAAITMKLSR